jgi:hypothetical protein
MILGGVKDTKYFLGKSKQKVFLKKVSKIDMGLKRQTRCLKHKKQRKHTHKRKKGGVNNNQYNDRRSNLINILHDMINELQQRIESGEENIDVMEYIDQLQGPLMDEAIHIDHYYENNDMEHIVNEQMNTVHQMLGMFNPNPNMLINNDKTVTIQGNNRSNNEFNNNSNRGSVNNNIISVYKGTGGKKKI